MHKTPHCGTGAQTPAEQCVRTHGNWSIFSVRPCRGDCTCRAPQISYVIDHVICAHSYKYGDLLAARPVLYAKMAMPSRGKFISACTHEHQTDPARTTALIWNFGRCVQWLTEYMFYYLAYMCNSLVPGNWFRTQRANSSCAGDSANKSVFDFESVHKLLGDSVCSDL